MRHFLYTYLKHTISTEESLVVTASVKQRQTDGRTDSTITVCLGSSTLGIKKVCCVYMYSLANPVATTSLLHILSAS